MKLPGFDFREYEDSLIYEDKDCRIREVPYLDDMLIRRVALEPSINGDIIQSEVDMIYFFISGYGIMDVGDERHEFRINDIILVHKNTKSQVRAWVYGCEYITVSKKVLTNPQ